MHCTLLNLLTAESPFVVNWPDIMQHMNRFVLIHGNGGGKGTDNWLPYLQANLKQRGFDCLAPNMPDPVAAKASVWLPFMKQELKLGPNDVVVGHSSGAVAALRYAELNKLAGVVVVGGYYTDLGYDDEKTSGYFDEPWLWAQIKTNLGWSAVFAAEDDPYIDIKEPRYIASQLDSELIELPGQGHFGYDYDKPEFPELLQYLEQKLKK